MEFRWFCRQTSESFPVDPENPENLLYKNGHVVPDTRMSQEETEQHRQENATIYQRGGCFGRGPGKKKKKDL